VLPARPVVGILSPGAMGAALGAALRPVSAAVLWAAAGRSDVTSKRAELADLVAVPDLPSLVRRSDVVIAVCPPEVALDVAREVAACGPPSVYVDANAVAPETARVIESLLAPARVVFAVIEGPPAWTGGQTTVRLTGAAAESVRRLLVGTPFDGKMEG
jgi:3-hydroxyisobutyrate dehydrogenase-like beta-hydroxyacid dehydrogenase